MRDPMMMMINLEKRQAPGPNKITPFGSTTQCRIIRMDLIRIQQCLNSPKNAMVMATCAVPVTPPLLPPRVISTRVTELAVTGILRYSMQHSSTPYRKKLV